MKKYYSLILIPLLGINSINNQIKINLQESNLKSENAVITDIETNEYTSGVVIDNNLDGFGDSLYMWGNNLLGQIPNQESNINIYQPKLIDYDFKGNIIDLEINYGTSAITVDSNYDGYADTLYMWGSNEYGQIGNGELNNNKVPITKITPQEQIDWGGNIIDLQLGRNYSGVIVDTNLDQKADTLYIWGSNIGGQIGNGTYGNNILYPIIIEPESGKWNGSIEKFDLGYDTSGIIINNNITEKDQLYMWGSSAFTVYGHMLLSYPTEIFPNNYIANPKEYWKNLTDISLAYHMSNGIVEDSNYDGYGDTVYLWGENDYGELANGEESSRIDYPTDNKFIVESNILDLEIGPKNSTVIIDSNYDQYGDTIYISGSNDSGQLGNGTIGGNALSPIKILPTEENNWNGNILKISLGDNDIMLLLDQDQNGLGDTLYMWGSNQFGQLGIGKEYDYLLAPQIIFSTYY